MPTQITRQSLTKTLDQRYASQRAGGTFDVKQRLGAPNTPVGSSMPIDGNQQKYLVDNFVTRMIPGITEFKDAIESNTSSSPRSKEISLHIKGFNNLKYKP